MPVQHLSQRSLASLTCVVVPTQCDQQKLFQAGLNNKRLEMFGTMAVQLFSLASGMIGVRYGS